MKIKEMLNNVGAVSKQLIVGGAIGVATLAVGIGLMNNFTSNGSVDQGFASNALEKSSYSSTYAGASAEDIISARDYNQGGREGTVSAITGTENLAFNKKTAAAGAAGGQGASAGVAAGEGAALEDDSMGYGSGEIEGMGTSNQISVDITQDMEAEAKAQAQRNAKIAKGQAYGEEARATLRTSKMASSGGISGMPTGSSSMSYNMGGANAGSSSKAGALDSSKIALAQAQLGNVNLAGAKIGKTDGMGAAGKEADSKKIGRATVGQNYESLGDLGRASKYSQSAKNQVGADNAQAAADASAAFDGSKEAEVPNLEGENLQKAAANALQGLSNNGGPSFDFSGLQEEIEEVGENLEKYYRLMDEYKMCIQAMILITCVAAIGLMIAGKFGLPGLIAQAIIFIIAIAGILACAVAASAILGKVAKLANETGYTPKPGGWDWAAPWVFTAIFSGLLVAAVAGINADNATLVSVVEGFITSAGGAGVMSTMGKLSSLGKSAKAHREAEKAAEEIKNQTDNLS